MGCSADHSEGSSEGGGDALGLGYGSDDGSGSEGGDSQGAEPSPYPAAQAPKADLAAEKGPAEPGLLEDVAAQKQTKDTATEGDVETQIQSSSTPAHAQRRERAPVNVRDHRQHQKGQPMEDASGEESNPGLNAAPEQAWLEDSPGIPEKVAENAPEAHQSLANGKAPAPLYSKGSRSVQSPRCALAPTLFILLAQIERHGTIQIRMMRCSWFAIVSCAGQVPRCF